MFFGTQRSNSAISPGRVPVKEFSFKGSGKLRVKQDLILRMYVAKAIYYLQDEKRGHLMSILEREQLKAKMDKIGHVLVQQLATKFGR